MKIAKLIPPLALALAACAQDDADNTAPDDTIVVDETIEDPATANLTLESDPAATDQAINQTDQQSDLGDAADNAVSSAGNTAQ